MKKINSLKEKNMGEYTCFIVFIRFFSRQATFGSSYATVSTHPVAQILYLLLKI